MENQLYRSWDDLAFEFRNRKYGAFLIRSRYSRNITLAVTFTVILAVGCLYAPKLAAYFKGEEVAELPTITKTIKYTDLAPPPPIDKNLPPPPKVNVQVKKVIKFLPPKLTEKVVEQEEDMPIIEELKTATTGAEDVEGVEEVVFEGPAVEVEEKTEEVYSIVEQMPEFDGGLSEMMAYLAKHTKYPSQARRLGIEGTVYVQFVIEQDGSVSSVNAIKGIGAGCDEEAARVIQGMPKWKPGKQNGDPVKVRFVLPIKFQLG